MTQPIGSGVDGLDSTKATSMVHKQIKLWEIISTKVLLDNDKLKVVEDQVKLPNGKITSYVKHAPTKVHAVIAVAVNEKNEILIQREYSHPPQKIMWQLPGGSMQEGETPKDAALRELAEESGYSAHSVTELGSFFVHNRLSNKIQYAFLCTDIFEHKLAEDEDEFIENHWFSKDKVKKMISDGEFDNINLLATLNLWLHNDVKELN